jgi:hypothetical protein
MKQFGIALVVASVVVLGCSGDPKPDPAKDAALKASFSKTPDINTLSPGMRKWVEGKIQESKNGKPSTNSKPPTAGQ